MGTLIDIQEDINKTVKLYNESKQYFSDSLIITPFYDDFRYSFCWSSNAIEGNTLTLEDTINFIDYDEVRSGHKFSEYEEAKRLDTAIKKYLSYEPQNITENWILNINSEITGDLKGYRKENVYIGNQIKAVFYPPSFESVPGLMSEFLLDINFRADEIGDIISKTARKHMEFERIHPFKDGNGRTGRLIMNQNLINNGLLPISIEPKSKYKQAFRTYDRNGDISLLEHIIHVGEQKALGEIKKLFRRYELTMKSESLKMKNSVKEENDDYDKCDEYEQDFGL